MDDRKLLSDSLADVSHRAGSAVCMDKVFKGATDRANSPVGLDTTTTSFEDLDMQTNVYDYLDSFL